MSNPVIKPVDDQSTSTKDQSREDRAYDLHRKLREANPGKDVEVTVGAKYGDGVSIGTKSEAGPFIAGTVVGLALAGLGALVGVSIWKSKQKPIKADDK